MIFEIPKIIFQIFLRVLDEDDDNIEKKSLSEMNNSVKKELKLELADEPAVED